MPEETKQKKSSILSYVGIGVILIALVVALLLLISKAQRIDNTSSNGSTGQAVQQGTTHIDDLAQVQDTTVPPTPSQTEGVTPIASSTPTATSPVTSSVTPTAAPYIQIAIDITDGGFSQSTIPLKKGQRYKILITNKGSEVHSLVSTLFSSGKIAPGQSKAVTITPTTTGTFTFHCTEPCYPFHSTMQTGYSFVVS